MYVNNIILFILIVHNTVYFLLVVVLRGLEKKMSLTKAVVHVSYIEQQHNIKDCVTSGKVVQ